MMLIAANVSESPRLSEGSQMRSSHMHAPAHHRKTSLADRSIYMDKQVCQGASAYLKDRSDAALDTFTNLNCASTTQQQGITNVVTATPEQHS